MSNNRPPEQVLTKPVACWLTNSDYNRLVAASDNYGVRVAVYIRAVIIDALADEDDKNEAKAVKLSELNKKVPFNTPMGPMSNQI